MTSNESSTESIYIDIIKSKNNYPVAVLKNNTTIFSKYDPITEAKNFFKTSNAQNFSFIITTGFAQSYHIDEILNNNKKCKIIIIEKSFSDFTRSDFFAKYEQLSKNKNIFFTDIANLEITILQNYFPACDGNFLYMPLRSWTTALPTESKQIENILKDTLQKIKADYSVQSHFGKIWMHNFFSNLTTINKHTKKIFSLQDIRFPTNKIAAIVAAGPSLDDSIKILKNNREKFFVVATDTAYKVLKKNNINIDAIVSIDAQSISSEHIQNGLQQNTLVALDVCGNPAILKSALNQNNNAVLFSCSHPLGSFLKNFIHSKTGKSISTFTSGNGTVTIAATDLAVQAGFKKILFLGADFSYLKNKPYAAGTYLDEIYRNSETKINNAETRFSALMYRTPLKHSNEIMLHYTTDVLDSYKSSLAEFIQKYSCEKKINFYSFGFSLLKLQDINDSLKTKVVEQSDIVFPHNNDFITKEIIDDFIEELNKSIETEKFLLMPLKAWVVSNKSSCVQLNELDEIDIAKNYIANYNKLL